MQWVLHKGHRKRDVRVCVLVHVCFGEVMERGRGDKRNEKRVSARAG